MWRDISLADMNSNETPVSTQNLGRDAEVAQAEQDLSTIKRNPRMKTKDESTDFTKYFSHPVKVFHLLWDTATGTPVNVTGDLFQLWLSSMDSRLQSKVKSFYYMGGHLRARVIVQGAAQYFGQLRFTFTPKISLPYQATLNTNGSVDSAVSVNSAILPHVTVDPSKNQTYEIDLPCPTPVGYWSLNEAALTSNFGSYKVDYCLINALRSGTAQAPSPTTGVNVCMYVYFPDAELLGLTMTSVSSRETKVSEIFSSVSGAASLAAPFSGEFAPEVTLFSQVSGALAKLLNYFGFSNPVQQRIEAFTTNRTCDNYSQCDGMSTSLVLGASQSQGVSLDPAVALGHTNDMLMSHLYALPSLLFNDFVVTNATAAESLVTCWVVSPAMVNQQGTSNTNTYLGPLAGFGSIHEFWCGDITYTVEFVASVFSRATFVIAWSPASSGLISAAPTMQQALNTLKTVTVQVVGNTSVDITIPYHSIYPACRVGPLFAWNNTVEQAVEGVTNGVVFVYCLNPVVDNGSSTPTVAFNVWIRSDNFAYFCPTLEKAAGTKYVTMTGSEMVESTQSVMFGGKTDVAGVNLIAFGDCPKSVKHIAARQTFVDKNQYAIQSGSNNWIAYTVPNIPVLNSASTSTYNSSYSSLLSYVSAAFLGMRGSIKYTCDVYISAGTEAGTLARCQSMHLINTTAAYAASPVGVNSGGASYAWTQPNLEVSSRVDVSVPMLFQGNFYPCRTFAVSSKDVVMFMGSNRTNTLNVNDGIGFVLAHGAGDDAVFTWFLGFPVGTYF